MPQPPITTILSANFYLQPFISWMQSPAAHTEGCWGNCSLKLYLHSSAVPMYECSLFCSYLIIVPLLATGMTFSLWSGPQRYCWSWNLKKINESSLSPKSFSLTHPLIYLLHLHLNQSNKISFLAISRWTVLNRISHLLVDGLIFSHGSALARSWHFAITMCLLYFACCGY